MGEHSRDVTAIITSDEPPTGTVLVVQYGEGWKVIVRDDKAAADAGYANHWFDASDMDNEPMGLHQHLKYADAVYALGSKLADFT